MTRSQLRHNSRIHREILRILIIMATVMTLLIATFSIAVNIRSDSRRLDQNLENIAQAIAQSQLVQDDLSDKPENTPLMYSYLDSLKNSLANIDVISIIGKDNVRKYHSNADLIGTTYDGTIPDFSSSPSDLYVTSDIGPSGSQRRAYAAIYDTEGRYLGFVLAVMLNQNIYRIITDTVIVHLISAGVVIFFAVFLSDYLSKKIKKLLKGYEPDTFSAMFSIRDNILESLEEGILAVGPDEKVVYANSAARKMLHVQSSADETPQLSEIAPCITLKRTLKYGEKSFGISVHPAKSDDILIDKIPVAEQGKTIGALCILRDRTEYTKMMEDLSGVRYMVECMRANNHDFINKLHVILGLIQMGNTAEASEYITHITAIQQPVLQGIMKSIEDPSVAALLIGKYSRASELNIRFTLKTGSRLNRSDISLPSGDLVTIIGNLLDNAMDSMNQGENLTKDLSIGIFTQPHAMLIIVDDTGCGMSPQCQEKIFDYGFSTKGENRGIGMHVTRQLIDKYEGTITVESEEDVGTSFTVTLTDGGDANV